MNWYDVRMNQDRDSRRVEPSELPDYGTADADFGLEPQDVDLIRWMLTLSPTQRLRYAQRFADGARKMRIASRA